MGPPPPQRRKLPGKESEMEPRPESQAREYLAAGKLRDQVVLITGGDSGIGRAVAVADRGRAAAAGNLEAVRW
jgi:hypothetical protein